MSVTIIKNTSLVEKNWGGRLYNASSQYTIQEIDRIRLLSDDLFLTDVNNDVAVINNGDIDLNSEQGLLYLNKQLVFIHDDMDLYPAVGENAAAAIRLSSAMAGFQFKIDDEMFSQCRLDDIVSNIVEFEIHLCCDNTESDKWIAFDVSFLTTTGGNDKICTNTDYTTTIGPYQLPTVANRIFRISAELPSSYFENNEKYVFLGIKRKDVTELSKTNPTNNPVLFRVCKIYTRRLDQ